MFPGNIDQGWFPRLWRRAARRVRFVESQFGAGACKWLVAFSFSANLEFCTIPTSPEISPSLRAGMRIRLGGSPFYHCRYVWEFEIEKLNGPLSIIVIMLICCSSKLQNLWVVPPHSGGQAKGHFHNGRPRQYAIGPAGIIVVRRPELGVLCKDTDEKDTVGQLDTCWSDTRTYYILLDKH